MNEIEKALQKFIDERIERALEEKIPEIVRALTTDSHSTENRRSAAKTEAG
jgi:hypothetical protein